MAMDATHDEQKNPSDNYCFLMSYPPGWQFDKGIQRDRTALGHELHMSRIIVLDLVSRGFVSPEKIKIITQPDRFFLYTGLFSDVHDARSYLTAEDGGDDLCATSITVDLTAYMRCHNISYGIVEPCPLDKLGYRFKSTGWNTRELRQLSERAIELAPLPPPHVEAPFLVVHFRFVETNSTDDAKTQMFKLRQLVEACRSVFPTTKIIVFWNPVEHEDALKGCLAKDPNLVWTRDLHTYASYLGHPNCLLFLSEWSGGGQISQYVSSALLLYYFDYYPSMNYLQTYPHRIRHVSSLDSKIWDYWDFKKLTNAKMLLLPSFADVIGLFSTPSDLPDLAAWVHQTGNAAL